MNNVSNRQRKVAELIREVLVEVLRKGKMLDMRLIDSNVTITKVHVAPDLKIADCYFMPFGMQKGQETELLDALEESKYSIRKAVTAKLRLKYSPELVFKYDHGFANANQVNSILSNLSDTE